MIVDKRQQRILVTKVIVDKRQQLILVTKVIVDKRQQRILVTNPCDKDSLRSLVKYHLSYKD